jgi:ABC-type transporter Mla MlaB component
MKPSKAAGKSRSKRRAPAKPAPKKRAVRKAAVRPMLALPAECVIASAGTLRTRLCELVDADANVTLDASAVQRIDTAGLQVLATFVRARQAAGLACEWTAVPATFSEAAQLLDLTTTLGLPA